MKISDGNIGTQNSNVIVKKNILSKHEIILSFDEIIWALYEAGV